MTKNPPSPRVIQKHELNKPIAQLVPAQLLADQAASERTLDECLRQFKTTQRQACLMTRLKQQPAELKATEVELRHLAYRDILTGLANRLLLREYLTREIVQARRRQTRLAALFVDLDYFGNINETFGHLVGDKVLKGVAARLTACVRASDIVSRYAGDQFVLVLADAGALTHVVQIAKQVIAQVSAPYPIGGDILQITASIGIAIYPENGKNSDTLVQNADAAMLGVKANGRNDYQFVTGRTPARSLNGVAEPDTRL